MMTEQPRPPQPEQELSLADLLQPPPEDYRAVFGTGKYRSVAEAWKRRRLIEVCDVREPVQRWSWLAQNIVNFNDPSVYQAPYLQWQKLLGFIKADLVVAARYAGIRKRDREIKRFERFAIATVAVTSTARALEAAAGDYEDYLSFILGAGPKGPVTNTQDRQGSDLLHGDPDKVEIVLASPEVRSYYDTLTSDASGGSERLLKYLRDKAALGGLDGYVDEVLLGGDAVMKLTEEQETRARFAAKLACDTFLVTGYSKCIGELDPKGKQKLQPVENWGGSAYDYMRVPALLPRIKGVYRGELGAEILHLIDLAVRPGDCLGEPGDDGKVRVDAYYQRYLTPADGTCNAKNMNRICSAIFALLGSRAPRMPDMSPQGFASVLEAMENLDQVYSGIEARPGDRLPTDLRAHVMGMIFARLFLAKAKAWAGETPKGDSNRKAAGRAIVERIFGKNLDGKDGDAAALQGERTLYVLSGNYFGADDLIKEAKNILLSNDQTK